MHPGAEEQQNNRGGETYDKSPLGKPIFINQPLCSIGLSISSTQPSRAKSFSECNTEVILMKQHKINAQQRQHA